MRKSNQKITDKDTIESILKKSLICRIAMIDGNMPYLLPFNYGYYENCIYIHSAPSGKKIDVLGTNPEVCFEIEEQAEILRDEKPCSWSTLYRSVIGHGNVEIVSDDRKKEQGLRIIMKHNGATEPFTFEENNIKQMVILKLKIEDITGKQSSNWNKIAWMQKYNIEAERLVLREITPDDMEKIHELRSFPEVDRYNTLGIPKDLQETVRIYKGVFDDKKNYQRKNIAWCIFLKDKDQFIGQAGMSLSADRFRLGEIYYNLLPEYWNKGYATETARALIQFGFNEMGLHKVEAGVATENVRSIRVLEKAGMTREGLRRKILPIRGEWKDNYHYAILESD